MLEEALASASVESSENTDSCAVSRMYGWIWLHHFHLANIGYCVRRGTHRVACLFYVRRGSRILLIPLHCSERPSPGPANTTIPHPSFLVHLDHFIFKTLCPLMTSKSFKERRWICSPSKLLPLCYLHTCLFCSLTPLSHSDLLQVLPQGKLCAKEADGAFSKAEKTPKYKGAKEMHAADTVRTITGPVLHPVWQRSRITAVHKVPQ